MRLLLLVVCISFLATGASHAEEMSLVRVVVSDNFGNRVRGVDVRLERKGEVTTVRDDVPVSLPYGEYSVSVRAQGFALSAYNVQVGQPQQVIALAVKLGAMEGAKPVCSIGGKVLVNQTVSRLRFIAVFGTYMVDVAVSDTGAYAFRGVECGEYVVVAFGAKDCIGARRITLVNGDTPVDLRFDASAIPNGCPLS